MTQTKNRYKAKIANKTYTIIGTESKVHMDIVTEIANKQLAEIRDIAPETTLENASILLGINALSDQLKKEEKAMRLEAQMKKMTAEMEELKNKIKRTEELEARLEKYTSLENSAKEALVNGGEQLELTDQELSPQEAQSIMNQQVREKIQQNSHEFK